MTDDPIPLRLVRAGMYFWLGLGIGIMLGMLLNALFTEANYEYRVIRPECGELKLEPLENVRDREHKTKEPSEPSSRPALTKSGISSWYNQRAAGLRADLLALAGDRFGVASRDHSRGSTLLVCRAGSADCIQAVVNDYGPEAWTGRQLDLDIAGFRELADPSRGLVEVEYKEL